MSRCSRCKHNDIVKSCTVDSDLLHHSFDGQSAIEYNPPSWQGLRQTKEWYHHGQLHRVDGPAVEWSDNNHEWYYMDQDVLLFTSNQETIIAKPIYLKEDVGTVLRHIEGVFYEVLLGNKKVLFAKV